MKPKSVPINVPRGTTQRVDFMFEDKPDLSSADITFTVKISVSSADVVLEKKPELSISNLPEGEFTIMFDPDDTADLVARSYLYEVKVAIDDEVYIPFLGAFNVFNTLT